MRSGAVHHYLFIFLFILFPILFYTIFFYNIFYTTISKFFCPPINNRLPAMDGGKAWDKALPSLFFPLPEIAGSGAQRLAPPFYRPITE
jgi:hypothetical protein